MLKRLGSHRAYLPLVVGLLVLTFLLTAVLAYQAQDADRQHREAAEAALRDYTELAADQWLNEFQPNLINGITGVWVAIKGGALIDDASALTPGTLTTILPDTALCRCLDGEEVLARLYFDAENRTVVSSSVLAESDYDQFWQGVESQPFARLSGRWSGAWFVVSDGRSPTVFSVLAELDSASRPVRGVAFHLKPEAVGDIANFIYQSRPLLFGNSPKAHPNDALFNVALSTQQQRSIYSTETDARPAFAAQRQLDPVAGSFVMSVSLKATAPDLL
ncbi:MAG TPA: hypothetical protein VFU06_04840, partial [Longimicrobiales bacterium]|nr:hypothetical protein [Longimicrobiales bacterium]